MMKVGIVGCGNIASKHISFVNQIDNAKLVAIADNNSEILKLTAEKYNITNCYSDVNELIERESPDVVHILTPPAYHRKIALDAIERGVDIYIEKPIVLNFIETKEIYERAGEKGVRICAGYNHLYDPCMRKADNLVKQGKIGEIVYLESHYGMNVLRRDLQTTTADNKTHWSYDLPGGLFQNYIDHPLYLLLKYIGDPLDIHVVTSSFGTLPQNMADELRVMIKGEKAVGLLIISFTEKPQLHFLNLYGQKGCVKINFDTMSTVFHAGSSPLPKAASKATFNLNEAYQLTVNTFKNVFSLLSGRLKPYQGMKDLIKEFYRCIDAGEVTPVSEQLVLNMSKTIDEIWNKSGKLHLDFSIRHASQRDITRNEKILVTGASGFLGIHTVRRLVEEGYYVRAFVRKFSRIDELESLGVEIIFGDIRDSISFGQAIKDMDIIIHLAAETSGDSNTSEQITVNGTQNLIRFAKKYNIRQVIYMSSMSVYDTVHAKDGDKFNEQSKREPKPKERGDYACSKKIAEDQVLDVLHEADPYWTVLRPAMIFGQGTDMFFGSIGISVMNKLIVVFGKGDVKIRLVCVEDVVEAIRLSFLNDMSRGKIYNVVHDKMVSKCEYLNKFFCPNVGKRKIIYFPYSLLVLCVVLQEVVFKLIRKKPYLTRYRLAASQREINFSTTNIKKDIAWEPRMSIDDQILKSFHNPESSRSRFCKN